MIENNVSMNRKTINNDRIGICPKFGCNYLKKVKPLKFKLFGIKKYPICPKHKISLVFINEFVEGFLYGVRACLFDKESIPPIDLLELTLKMGEKEFRQIVNLWMYSNPIGRGAQIVSRYMDGLSKGYLKELSRKQRKSLMREKSDRKRFEMLRKDFNKISENYTNFMKYLNDRYALLFNPEYINPVSKNMKVLLKNWLKDHLKIIQTDYKSTNGENGSLEALKQEIDIILQVGTCSVILGKVPRVVIKGFNAFELFSLYSNFLYNGLCDELTLSNLKNLIENPLEFLKINCKITLNNKLNPLDNQNKEIEKLENINVPNFRQKALKEIDKIINHPDFQSNKNDIIKKKSIKILNEHILRATEGEFTIPKNANMQSISSTIIFTALISTKNVNQINVSKISGIGQDLISQYYARYFKPFYPRIKFHFNNPKFKFMEIRKKVALFFFENMIENKKIKNPELVEELMLCIRNNSSLNDLISKREIHILNDMLLQHRKTFIKHFSQLAEVIRYVKLLGQMHKEIRAHIIIKYLSDSLEKKGITLNQKSDTFKSTLIELYDYLKESKYSKYLPIRSATQKSLSKNAKFKRYNNYRKIVSYRIKLYVIKNIYDGKYTNNYKCPFCEKEGYQYNTDIVRLRALEFHHRHEKECEYTTATFYELFMDNRANENFLSDLIKKMESEKVILICRNHHRAIFHGKIINIFRYLINWEKIFSFPAELIHILIRTSVESYYEASNLSNAQKRRIRLSITRALKKRFILEYLYGENCPICGEFNIKQHLEAFDFCHKLKEKKSINASDLFQLYDCREILMILEGEIGMYMCSNCHTVMHNANLEVLNEVYNDQKILNKIDIDSNILNNRFAPIQIKKPVRTPLKKNLLIDGFIERLLITMYEILKFKKFVTSNDLKNEFGLTRTSIIFKSISRKESFLAKQINIIPGKGRTSAKINLTESGYSTTKLILHFRNYFRKIY